MQIKVFADYDLINGKHIPPQEWEDAIIEQCKVVLHKGDFCVTKNKELAPFVDIPVKGITFYSLEVKRFEADLTF